MNRCIERARSIRAFRWLATALLGGVLFVASPPAAAAQGPRAAPLPGSVQCQKCHANRDFLVGKTRTVRGDSALFVPDSLVRDSKHARLSCSECHPGYGRGYPHATQTVAVRCESCHRDQGAAWARSIHAVGAGRRAGDSPTCVTCHGQHNVLGADDPRSPTFALNVAKTCGSCHSDRRIIGTYFKDSSETQARTAVPEYQSTVHGLAASRSGLVVAATCNDCHGAHDVLPPDSASSTINRARVAETCGACHAGVLATFDSSSHGRALVSGRKTESGHAAPVCTDCHVGHQIAAAKDSAWFLGVVGQCGKCHERLTETYKDTYHGQVTELGFGLTAKCSDCHTAHAMLPASDPKSSVNAANLVATCSKCHPGANAKFTQYLPHADPQHRAKNPGLYWVWLFMTALLIGVFSFFGLHTLLWLGRLLVERLRGGASGRQKPGGASSGGPGPHAPVPSMPLANVRQPSPAAPGGKNE